jgi:Flp pilus assembly pilin Flp
MLNYYAKRRFGNTGCESITQRGEGRSRNEKGGEKMKNLIRYLRDQQGIETLEWILMGALIVALGIAVYPGTLQTGIESVITDIVTAMTALN